MSETYEKEEVLIIDTDVLIWHLRGNTHAQKVITENIPYNYYPTSPGQSL